MTGGGDAVDTGASSAPERPADAGELSDGDHAESDSRSEGPDELDAFHSDSGTQDSPDDAMTEAGE